MEHYGEYKLLTVVSIIVICGRNEWGPQAIFRKSNSRISRRMQYVEWMEKKGLVCNCRVEEEQEQPSDMRQEYVNAAER